MCSCTHQSRDAKMQRGLTAGSGNGGGRTFESGHAFLENRHGRIGDA